ncbi:MAG: DUF2493 domain-containing protein [Bacteroidota bacterium]
MRVAVIGSRRFENKGKLFATLSSLESHGVPSGKISLIVSGGALGADKLAEAFALEHGIPLLIFRPEYDRFGRNAPLKRNFKIVDSADLVVAFWDGVSRGTKHGIDYAIRQKKRVIVVSEP